MSLYPHSATSGSSNNRDNSTCEMSHSTNRRENSTSGTTSVMTPTHLQRQELCDENLTMREEAKFSFNPIPYKLSWRC
jgi:hypothetical protein